MKKCISALVTSVILLEAGAAYAAGNPIIITELNFGKSITENTIQSFDGGKTYEWKGNESTSVSAAEENGNYFLSAEGEAGVEVNADLGRELFMAAAPKGTLYWDFEDTVTFEDDNLGVDAIDAEGNVTGDYIDKIAYGEDVASPDEVVTEVVGKWTGVNYNPGKHWRINPVYTPMDNVITYNNVTRLSGTLTGAGAEAEVPDTADPVKGSNQVCVVRKDGSKTTDPRARMLGIRVKLSKDMIEPDKTYNLSFHVANNSLTATEYSKNMLLYAMFKPFSKNDNINIATGATNDVKWIDFTKYLLTTDGKAGVQRYWQRVETTLDLTEADFDEEGYTTLWLIACGWINDIVAQPTQVYGPSVGSCLYFDNIAISPVENEVTEKAFSFNCAVKGESGDEVEVSLALDGKRSFMKKSITLENDGWNTVSGSFDMKADDEYIAGEKHGDTKQSNDGRVKLSVKSSGTELAVDDVVFICGIQDEFNKYGGKNLVAAGTIYNTDETLETAKFNAVMNMGASKNIIADKSISLVKGYNSFFAEMPMTAAEEISDDSYLEYKITNESGGCISENVGFERFFVNGVNILEGDSNDFSEMLKAFGKGTYLVEFDLSDVSENETVTVSCSGEKTTVTADTDGTYQAELDIEKISDTAKVEVKAKTAQVSNITIKKTADL